MTYRGMKLECASCGQELAEARVYDRQAQRCPGCNAFWIEASTLAVLIERGYRAKGKKDAPDLVEFEDGSPRHACLVCREEMHSVWLELLRFERCTAHGYWLPGVDVWRVLRADVIPDNLPAPKPDKRPIDGGILRADKPVRGND